MKKISLGVLITLVIAASSAMLNARGDRQEKGPHKEFNIEKHLEKMTRKFGLTTDQQAEIKKIMEEKKQKMEELGKQMRDLMDGYRDKIHSLLNDEQKVKFKKFKGEKGHGCPSKCCRQQE